jgi:hypothetical protein
MSDELTLYSPSTGELVKLAVADASDEEIADALTRIIPEISASLDEAVAITNRELVARLDRSGRWTRRVGAVEDGVQFEIRCPSPTAGTAGWDLTTLQAVLDELIAEEVIDIEAAANALEHTVTAVYRVPDPEVSGRLIECLGADERVVKLTHDRKVKDAGVGGLSKIPGVAERLREAELRREPAPRRASIKRIERTT